MAVNGQMAFPNGAAAEEGTRKFAQTISHIELKWGDDLRVDPLTTHLAAIAVSLRIADSHLEALGQPSPLRASGRPTPRSSFH